MLKEPGGLALPKVRKAKRLLRVLSQDQVARLIHRCDLYDKALLATIYDCSLRVSEAYSLRWDDINFDRQQQFIYQGKGMKDRCVTISSQLLILLDIFRKGWDIGTCKDCNCQRIITRIIKPAPRTPPSMVWEIGN